MEFMKGHAPRNIIIFFLALFLIAVSLALFISSQNVQINKHYTAILVDQNNNESQSTEQMTIKINGTLKKGFREFTFSGTINIEGYERSQKNDIAFLSLELSKSALAPRLFEGNLIYTIPMLAQHECLGKVFVDSEFNVFFFEPEKSGQLFAAPAENSEQASELVRTYFPQGGLVSSIQ